MSKKSESQVQQAGAAAAIMEPEINPGDLPSQEEIATLAYSYWESRGYQGGSPEEDWIKAEREVRDRQPSGRSAP